MQCQVLHLCTKYNLLILHFTCAIVSIRVGNVLLSLQGKSVEVSDLQVSSDVLSQKTGKGRTVCKGVLLQTHISSTILAALRRSMSP